MAVTILLMLSLLGGSAVSSEAIRWFPGDYFNSYVKAGFQAEVMKSWPGPSQLMRTWNAGGLQEPDRVSLLLGGAIFHDPVLLPAYHEAVTSSSPRVRQAAVYGYRDLLGDSLPDVNGGISDGDAALLGEEMDWMMRTIVRRSLLEVWLQAVLAHEGRGLPEWRGVTLQRQPEVALRAIEKVAAVEDLEILLEAYDISGDFGTRVNLLKLVEALTLSRFIVMPEGSGEGWGRQVYVNAMGVTGVDTRSEEGCQVWVNVLERGDSRWWMLASRRLYACGGPWLEISALYPNGPRDQERRTRLLAWFKPLRPNG
ncbi:MAG: hypothetical protein QNL88_05360 [Acidobacteriota bacterium]|nr:hypothetical protein [Acidobacteriota bacterium]